MGHRRTVAIPSAVGAWGLVVARGCNSNSVSEWLNYWWAGRCDAGFKVAGGRVEKRKAPSWQGTQVKKSAAGGEKRLKKAQRATPGSTALSRELGGPSKKGKKRRAGGSADGGIPREKGKRPAVAGKKTKQLAVKAGVAAPKFKSPNKTPGRGSKPPGRKSG